MPSAISWMSVPVFGFATMDFSRHSGSFGKGLCPAAQLARHSAVAHQANVERGIPAALQCRPHGRMDPVRVVAEGASAPLREVDGSVSDTLSVERCGQDVAS